MKNQPSGLICTPLIACQAPTAYQPAQTRSPSKITRAMMAAGENEDVFIGSPSFPLSPGCKKAKICARLASGREPFGQGAVMNRKQFLAGLAATVAAPPAALADKLGDDAKYTANEITQAGADFFGITTEAMAKGVQHVFADLGEPDAYIKGDEGSGAFVVGLRYGSGWLIRKTRDPLKVYWRGPSIGFDAGGNAS